MPSHERDKVRIAQAIMDIQSVGVEPSPQLISRALGWHLPVSKPYWSALHNTLYDEVITDMVRISWQARRKDSTVGQLYPATQLDRNDSKRPYTFLAWVGTRDYG